MKLVGKTFDGEVVEVELSKGQHLEISGDFATGKTVLLRSMAENLGEKLGYEGNIFKESYLSLGKKVLFFDDIDNPEEVNSYMKKANDKGIHLVFTKLTDSELGLTVI